MEINTYLHFLTITIQIVMTDPHTRCNLWWRRFTWP